MMDKCARCLNVHAYHELCRERKKKKNKFPAMLPVYISPCLSFQQSVLKSDLGKEENILQQHCFIVTLTELDINCCLFICCVGGDELLTSRRDMDLITL